MKRLSWCCICLLWAVGCLTSWWIPACQAADDVTFRDLARKYFKDGDGADLAKVVGYTQPVKKVIALEYKVLLFADGRERPVDPKTYDFRIGDKIRIAIEPLHDYYIYIFHIGASGQSEFLLPAEGREAAAGQGGQTGRFARRRLSSSSPSRRARKRCWWWPPKSRSPIGTCWRGC